MGTGESPRIFPAARAKSRRPESPAAIVANGRERCRAGRRARIEAALRRLFAMRLARAGPVERAFLAVRIRLVAAIRARRRPTGEPAPRALFARSASGLPARNGRARAVAYAAPRPSPSVRHADHVHCNISQAFSKRRFARSSARIQ
jgi:hypothetical protein